MLALVAALAAVGAAQWGGSILRTLLLPGIHWATASVNWHVAIVALAIALLAGTAAGLIPAIQASRPNLSRDLKSGAQDGGVQRSTLQSSLVVVQAALTVMLLAGAALFVKSIQNVHDLDIGFASDRLVFAAISFDSQDTVREARIRPAIDEIASRMRHMPGVEAVALAGMQPMNGFALDDWFTDKTFPNGKAPNTTYSAVSPEYFAATGLRIVRGTGFPSVRGAAMPRVVVINSAMANAVWPGENPIGRCMRFGKEEAPCYTITGVAANASRDRVVENPMPQYYLPLDNMPTPGWSRNPTLVVRAEPDRIGALIGELRAELHAAWPEGAPKVTRMSDALEPQYRPWKLGATLFSAFGLVALVIAAVGIFSTVSYAVNQRTHEFGVRIALGARIGDVLRLVVGDGVRTAALGVAIGIVLALAAGRAIESLLYGIKASNPAVILLVAAILLTVAIIAALGPAWRASRVDPMTALRME
jgi:putative ABC transport system permease protein